jgi:hypothetical protein
MGELQSLVVEDDGGVAAKNGEVKSWLQNKGKRATDEGVPQVRK